MKKNIVLLLAILWSYNSTNAQTNLVPNHDFNIVGKKAKDKGQINLAEPWMSPTLTQADLFMKSSKNAEIGVPDNFNGAETPMEGDNFSGIVAYSYKGKTPRSYLQVKLAEALKNNQEYCVTFHVSLADLSKFSTNYIGAYISNDAVSANNSDVLLFEPQIVSRKLVVYEQQFYWTPICAVYKAKGGEQFLTIGNFTEEEKLTIGKVKRPQGFNSPQISDAYYYVDNVIVIPRSSENKCDCDFVVGEDDLETINRSFNSEVKNQKGVVNILNSDGKSTMTGNSLNKNYTILFEFKQIDLTNESTKKLDELIVNLKSNPKNSISIAGYYDGSENEDTALDAKRIGSVYKYIVSKGIVKERVSKSTNGIAKDMDATKNMKVEINMKNN